MKHLKSLIILPLLVPLFTACEADPESVTFSVDEIGEANIHTEDQENFWNDNNMEKSLLQYGMGDENKEKPLPVKLSWKVTKAKKYTINVSEKEDMSNSWSFETKKMNYDLYNCKTGTKYYFTITAHYKSNDFTSEVNTFSIKSGGTRNIYIDGVNNVRDIGGFMTDTGHKVKQGMIYRTAKLNESDVKTPVNVITKAGIKTMKEQLNIKTDIDLRKIEVDEEGVNEIGGITSSPLGDDVQYVNCPMYYEGSAVIGHTSSAKDAFNKESIKNMFDVLGEENNYPLIFHCTQGKDRTGALAYLMETLLGMETNDIYHDYLYTNMSQVGGYCAYKAFSNYNFYLNKQSGDSLKEKAFNYLLSIGVSEQKINNFLSLMSE